MIEKIVYIYALIFARPILFKFNKLLFRLSIAGLGILNYKNTNMSGERAFLKKYLANKDGVVIDVGANKGGYTSDVLSFHPRLEVYAFEPHPITFEKLKLKFEGSGNIKITNAGISSKSGILSLYDYASNDGSTHASLYQGVLSEIHKTSSIISHEVKLITLDEFVQEHNIKDITLLKIDTEGNELEVLRGCVKTLEANKVKAIHFEFNEMNVISRCHFKDFWNILSEKFDLYRLLPNGMIKIKHYSPLYCELFAYQNIVAILSESKK
jgi:FkbM family methyltransferase